MRGITLVLISLAICLAQDVTWTNVPASPNQNAGPRCCIRVVSATGGVTEACRDGACPIESCANPTDSKFAFNDFCCACVNTLNKCVRTDPAVGCGSTIPPPPKCLVNNLQIAIGATYRLERLDATGATVRYCCVCDGTSPTSSLVSPFCSRIEAATSVCEARECSVSAGGVTSSYAALSNFFREGCACRCAANGQVVCDPNCVPCDPTDPNSPCAPPPTCENIQVPAGCECANGVIACPNTIPCKYRDVTFEATYNDDCVSCRCDSNTGIATCEPNAQPAASCGSCQFFDADANAAISIAEGETRVFGCRVVRCINGGIQVYPKPEGCAEFCLFNGVQYPNGATWSRVGASAGGANSPTVAVCGTCTCDAGTVTCTGDATCVSTCVLPDGRVINNGESYKSPDGGCTSWRCDGGQLIPVVSDVCYCYSENGVAYPAGSVVPNTAAPTEGCERSCMCDANSGEIVCRNTCVGKCVRDDTGAAVELNAVWEIGCRRCICTANGVACTEDCPAANCRYNDVVYKNGERWEVVGPDNTVCDACVCNNGNVVCNLREANAPVAAVCNVGCQNPEPNAALIPNGITRPRGDGCNTCICVSGRYACTDRVCVPPTEVRPCEIVDPATGVASTLADGETQELDTCTTVVCLKGQLAFTRNICEGTCRLPDNNLPTGGIINKDCYTCYCDASGYRCEENPTCTNTGCTPSTDRPTCDVTARGADAVCLCRDGKDTCDWQCPFKFEIVNPDGRLDISTLIDRIAESLGVSPSDISITFSKDENGKITYTVQIDPAAVPADKDSSNLQGDVERSLEAAGFNVGSDSSGSASTIFVSVGLLAAALAI